MMAAAKQELAFVEASLNFAHPDSEMRLETPDGKPTQRFLRNIASPPSPRPGQRADESGYC
jgi:hypothetical protein